MKKKILFSLLLSTFLLGSCDDDFLDRPPIDQVTDENFWQTEEQLQLAVDAMYGYLKAKNTVDMEIMGDNTFWPAGNNYKSIGSGNYSYDLSTVNDEWSNLYTGIRQANTFLENYKKATVQDPERAEELASQVRIIRAYLYSYLTFFYGDVPLITTPLNILSTDELYGPRTPREEVVDFMLADLDEAAQHLSAAIPTGENVGRLNKGAALALKARIALYNQRWEVAAEAAKAVMDLGVYQLFDVGDSTSNYRRLFTYEGKLSGGKNKETIIVRTHLEGVTDHNLSREIQVPDQGVRWNPTKSLVDAYLMEDGLPIDKSPLYHVTTYDEVFQNRDPRMTQTVLEPGSAWGGRYDASPEHKDSDPSNDHPDIFMVPKLASDKKGAATYTGYYFTKYVELSTVGDVSQDVNDIHLLRYAEVLLTYAEAKMELGELTQEVVDMTINKLRDRVGMKHMELAELAANGLDVREEVHRERRVELAMEGQRYFDIIRWKKGELLAQDVKGTNVNWLSNPKDAAGLRTDDKGFIIVLDGNRFEDPRNYLWPVPMEQVQLNPELGQNPGW